jgi:N-acyl homoserine lactone hydrolase
VPGPLRVPATLVNRGWLAPLPIRAWLVEHPDGLLLVDTGENARAGQPGYFPAWHPYYRRCVKLHVTPDDEIGPQLRALGVSPDDVRWVVLTHLHTDHAGGLEYFPRAEIVVSRREWRFATSAAGLVNGYPRRRWPSWLDPTLAEPGPFIDGVTLLDTRGHTPGHISVLVDDRYLIAGDASYTEQLMLEGALDGVAPDPKAYRATLTRLQALVARQPTVYLPTHDPEAVARLQA